MKIDVTIKSIEATVHSATADEVILPALYGVIGIKANHANTSAILTHGEIVIKLNNTQESIAINGGIAQITANKVEILLNNN